MKNGRTLYICWGSYGGFGFECNKYTLRIVLGRVSFAYMKADIEKLIDYSSAMAVALTNMTVGDKNEF